ncbi:MAG: ATP-grasp domain-containing protein [Firmicutes bacterium]|nr:ATP-grasp domain-containing protein [Bacillota bacterium]
MPEDGYIFIINPCDEMYRRYILEDISNYYSRLALITTKEISWEANYVKNAFIIKEYNEANIIEVIQNFKIFHPVSGILTYSEKLTNIVGNVADYFGFRGVSKDAAQSIRNKFIMRQKFKENSAPTPDFQLIRSTVEASEFIKKNGFPVVIKPTLGGSSEAVVKINDYAELERYFTHVYDLSFSKFGYSGILIEEYIEGIEVSVEAAVNNGEVHIIMVTDKEKGAEPFFLETGHIVPSQLPEEIKNVIRETAIKGIKALKIQNGITHTEIKWSKEKGPYVIEIGGRLGGDFIPHIVNLATGINLNTVLIDIILGRELKIEQTENNFCAVRFICPKTTGIFLGFGNTEKVLQKENAVSWKLKGTMGNKILLPPEEYQTRLGYYILKEKSYPLLAEKLDRITKNIELEIL